MRNDEFNQKYKAFLQEGYYGLAINKPKVIEYLDERFQEFIKRPNFNFAQIKVKWGEARFYANGLTIDDCNEIENQINKLL